MRKVFFVLLLNLPNLIFSQDFSIEGQGLTPEKQSFTVNELRPKSDISKWLARNAISSKYDDDEVLFKLAGRSSLMKYKYYVRVNYSTVGTDSTMIYFEPMSFEYKPNGGEWTGSNEAKITERTFEVSGQIQKGLLNEAEYILRSDYNNFRSSIQNVRITDEASLNTFQNPQLEAGLLLEKAGVQGNASLLAGIGLAAIGGILVATAPESSINSFTGEQIDNGRAQRIAGYSLIGGGAIIGLSFGIASNNSTSKAGVILQRSNN